MARASVRVRTAMFSLSLSQRLSLACACAPQDGNLLAEFVPCPGEPRAHAWGGGTAAAPHCAGGLCIVKFQVADFATLALPSCCCSAAPSIGAGAHGWACVSMQAAAGSQALYY